MQHKTDCCIDAFLSYISQFFHYVINIVVLLPPLRMYSSVSPINLFSLETRLVRMKLNTLFEPAKETNFFVICATQPTVRILIVITPVYS